MGLLLKILSAAQFKTPSKGVLFLGAVLFLMTAIQPAKAIMVWPAQDRYQPANVEQMTKIKSVRPLAPYARGSNYRLFVGEDYFHDFKSVYVRIESKDCGEYCLTVFFVNDITSRSMKGAAYLPRKSTRGDTSKAFCSACEMTGGVLFSGKDKDISVMISKSLVTFDFRNTEKRE